MSFTVCHIGSQIVPEGTVNADCVYFSDSTTGLETHDRVWNVLRTVPEKYIKWTTEPVEMTQAEKDAVDAALLVAEIAAAKTAAKNLYDALDSVGRIIRAEGKLMVDEINVLRQWITSFKAATAAATSLSNLQTRVAALPNMPDRTYAQAKNAIQTLVDGE